jgi:uncharacterized membrane protein
MKKTYFLAINGILIALIFILGFTPLGLIPLGSISLTILHIPVIVGTILLGLPSGLVLGASFGLVSLLNLLRGADPTTGALLAAAPFAAVLMCIVPRLLVPTITHAVYRVIARRRTKYLPAVPFAAFAGSMTNTVFFLGFLYAGYALAGLNPDGVFLKTLLTVAGINGSLEALAATLICSPIAAAVWKVKREKKGS